MSRNCVHPHCGTTAIYHSLYSIIASICVTIWYDQVFAYYTSKNTIHFGGKNERTTKKSANNFDTTICQMREISNAIVVRGDLWWQTKQESYFWMRKYATNERKAPFDRVQKFVQSVLLLLFSFLHFIQYLFDCYCFPHSFCVCFSCHAWRGCHRHTHICDDGTIWKYCCYLWFCYVFKCLHIGWRHEECETKDLQ